MLILAVTTILSAPCAAYLLFFDQNKLTLDGRFMRSTCHTFAELPIGRHALSLLIAQRDRFAVRLIWKIFKV